MLPLDAREVPSASEPPAPSSRGGSLVGKTLAERYFISSLVGIGGMGEVYASLHIGIGRRVAVKVLRRDVQAHEPSAVERLRREARSAAATNHPNVIEVFDVLALDDGLLAIVMEYLDGPSLQDVLAADTMLPPRVVHIGLQIARAISAAHAVGVIHRDLKPENIVLLRRDDDPDYVKVLDFGIATDPYCCRAERPLTCPGFVMGTPDFMAPEQFAGADVGPPADIYAIGAILYLALTGRKPFAALTVIDLLTAKLTTVPEAPSRVVPCVPPELDRLILEMLATEPESRPGMVEVKQRLASLARVLEWPVPEDPVATPKPPAGTAATEPRPASAHDHPGWPEGDEFTGRACQQGAAAATPGEYTRELATAVTRFGAWPRWLAATALLAAGLGLIGGFVRFTSPRGTTAAITTQASSPAKP